MRAPEIDGLNSTSYGECLQLIDVLSVRDGEERKRTWGGREGHSIVIERGRHKKTWLPRENRLCTHCSKGVVDDDIRDLLFKNRTFDELDDEFLFLTECNNYIRETYF